MQKVFYTLIIALSLLHTIHAQGSETYQLIASLVSKYTRPLTILDFGAGDGCHSFALASNFPHATCVMIEDNNNESDTVGDSLLKRCHEHKHLKNIMYLKKFLDVKELFQLSECEHFDVIIAGNVLHYFGSQWHKAFSALHQMGDHVIIENPPVQVNTSVSSNNARRSIDRFLRNHKTPILGKVSRKNTRLQSTVYHLYTGNYHTIDRKNYLCQKKLPKGSRTIESSYTSKKMIKSKYGKVTTYPWIAGIHFFTFKSLGGCYPEQTSIKKSVNSHTVLMQGSRILQIPQP